jgi:hypothetical protein
MQGLFSDKIFVSSEFEEYAYSECSSLSLAEFIVEWELRLDAATAAGCHYSEVGFKWNFVCIKLLRQRVADSDSVRYINFLTGSVFGQGLLAVKF